VLSGGRDLFSWGVNFHGELGDGSTSSTTNPVAVFRATGLNGWRRVSGGFAHVLAIGDDEQLYSWGDNSSGQLGYGATRSFGDYLVPTPVPPPAGATGWQAITAGNSSSLALSKEGEIYGWGLNSQGNLGIGTNLSSTVAMFRVPRPAGVVGWKAIAAGQSHGLAIANDGRLFAWGAGSYGQLGTGSTTNAFAPVQVGFPVGVTNWISICAGLYHSLAIGSEGELYAWGRNNSGQLGIGNTNNQLTPVHVNRPAGVTAWAAIASGAYHALALATNGNLYSWGNNYNGQLGLGYTNTGIGSQIPVPVPFPIGTTRWVTIGSSGTRSLALDENCRLFRWGGEGNGLGGSDSPSFAITQPALVPQLDSLCITTTNLSPSIEFVSPTNGATLSTSSNLLLQASASDPDGQISSVKFYSSYQLLGIVTNAPYQLWVSNLSAGEYIFKAAATDNRGASVMSIAKQVFVNDDRYFHARINFQPAGTDVPLGYYADTGLVYADRGNGLTYGWSTDNSTNIFDRNSLTSPDQRYDTVAYLQRGGNHTWEIQVPNGFYEVHLVRGDPIYEPHFFQTVVENWLVGDNGAYDWDENWLDVVTVTDGKLSISDYYGNNDKICFVEIQGIDAPPMLTITANDAFASEGILSDGTTNTAKLTITRVGSTNAALWVTYNMSGSASNGIDFTQVYQGATDTPWSGSRGSFYIPAGQTSVSIIVSPMENDLVQSNKTVTFSLEWNINYNLVAGVSNATVTIADNDFVATGPSAAVALTYPTSTDQFIAPTNILLQAQAGQGAGVIERMDFLVNGQVVGSSFTPPYIFLWTNVPAGFATITARALNSLRASIYSASLEMLIFGPEPPRPARLALQPVSSSSYLINTNGMLFTWGNNSFGQLGFGNTIDGSRPQNLSFPPGVTGWNEVSGGNTFSLAIASDGHVYSWGRNNLGQLGLGQTNDQSVPVLLASPTNVVAWRITAGSTHSLMLDSFGRLYSWGSGDYGELGNGTTNSRTVPQLVAFPAGVTVWSAIAAGNRFSLAIGDDGNLYSWGRNNFGQLGNNGTNNSLVPVKLSLTTASAWKSVAAGNAHAMALSADGHLYSWGFNYNSQLGYSTLNYGNPTASLVPQPTGVTSWMSVALGGAYSMALDQNGKLYAWGYNLLGYLGTSETKWNITAPTPVLFPVGVNRWLDFTAGNQHSLAIGDNGHLYSWGSGVALGQGDVSWLSIPTELNALADMNFVRSVPAMGSVAIRERKFQFRVAGIASGNTCVEWSTNLHTWFPLCTNSTRDFFFTVPISSPALKQNGIEFLDLEEMALEDFSGKLAILGPFLSQAQMRVGLAQAVLRIAKNGAAVVWIQPPPDSKDEIKPSFYVVPEGKGAVVIVQPDLVADFSENPKSQMNLIYFCKLALHPAPLPLPNLPPQP
jgi:alpha-tubulin suppressor-like RCC1 family protein